VLAAASAVKPPDRAPGPAAPLGGLPARTTRASIVNPGVPEAAAAAPASGPGRAPSPRPEGTPPAAAADPAVERDVPVIPDVAGPLQVDLPLVAKLVAADAALVVDAREASEFAAGHIPGAVNVPFDDAYRNPGRLETLEPRGRPIVVYCSGGTCESSRMLAEMLVRDHGKRRVLVFEAGFPEWANSGQPVSRGTP
jgi:rhodanese-related sulfurtransferase